MPIYIHWGDALFLPLCSLFKSLSVQFPTRLANNPRYFLHLFLGKRPVICINGISDRREERLVVSAPGLGRENYMFELCAIGDLYELLKSFHQKNRWTDSKELTPPPSSRSKRLVSKSAMRALWSMRFNARRFVSKTFVE